TTLRVKKGAWAPDRLRSMPSCPATGTTRISVILGAPFASRVSLMVDLRSGGLQLEALDLAHDEQVAEDGRDGVRADEDERAVEVAAALHEVADDDGRRDGCGVAEHVEQAAREAGDLLRRGVGYDGPAERADALPEEGERHDDDDGPLRVDVVAGDHARREQHAEDDGGLARDGERRAAPEQAVGEDPAEHATEEAAQRRQGRDEADLEDRHAARLDE